MLLKPVSCAQTDRQTSFENIVSAIYSVHLAEIIKTIRSVCYSTLLWFNVASISVVLFLGMTITCIFPVAVMRCRGLIVISQTYENLVKKVKLRECAVQQN